MSGAVVSLTVAVWVCPSVSHPYPRSSGYCDMKRTLTGVAIPGIPSAASVLAIGDSPAADGHPFPSMTEL